MGGDASSSSSAHAAALRLQATQCAALGSPMYEGLFHRLADWCIEGSALSLALGNGLRPVHDAVPLRLAGGVHRAVLMGDAPPELSRHYPTAGGTPSDSYAGDFLTFVLDNPHVVELGLSHQVQTNEVRRGVVLHAASRWITQFGVREFDLFEIGSSAGLNLLFDLYPEEWFANGIHDMGSHSSILTEHAEVRGRRGCDPYPVNIRDDHSVTWLKSFVWPDQSERHQRLEQAIQIARRSAVEVDRRSADSWLAQVLPHASGARMVFHSIVWQYLGHEVQQRVRDVLSSEGMNATPTSPLIWLRMEPNGPMADVRATVWCGENTPREYVLADVGYHGDPFVWRI